MIRFHRFSAGAALAAALSMAASPVFAADFPVPTSSFPMSASSAPLIGQWDGDATNVERHRRWRNRDRVDAGDILTGVLIIGGIAAIANAATNNDNRRDRPRDDYRYREAPSNHRDNARTGDNGQGINRAVDMCLAEIERDVRVEEVSNVARSADGWIVSGRLYNGDGFDCRIGNDGRIADIDFAGRQAYSGAAQDRQWNDEDYSQARLRTGAVPYGGAQYPSDQARPDYADDSRPAYPGGPVDSDLEAEGDGYGG